MPDEPTYPKDAPVGSGPASESAKESTVSPAPEPQLGGDNRRKKHVRTGVAVGIGSAAIVAALLYAKSGKRSGGKQGS